MRLVNTDGWTDNGEIHKVIKLCLTRKMRNVERVVWGRIAENPSGLRRILVDLLEVDWEWVLRVGRGAGHWQCCSLPLPSIPHSAGRPATAPPAF